jgi:hypothetical protein
MRVEGGTGRGHENREGLLAVSSLWAAYGLTARPVRLFI